MTLPKASSLLIVSLSAMILLSLPSCMMQTDWPYDAREAAKRQDDAAKSLGAFKELNLPLGRGVEMKLALIPTGKFKMGTPDDEKGRNDDEGPQHDVTITKPFYLGAYHVTVGQFRQFGVGPINVVEVDHVTL